MAVEVPCPNCQAVLRAPENAAGKRVKCKKCEHRFVIPTEGDAQPPASVGESQMLSVIEEQPTLPAPIAAPVVVAPANAFAFDSGGDGEPGGGEVVVRVNSRHAGRPKKPGGSSRVLLFVGLAGFLLFLGVAGGGAAIYFLVLAPGTTVAEATSTPASAGPTGKAVPVPKGQAKTDVPPQPPPNDPPSNEPVRPVPPKNKGKGAPPQTTEVTTGAAGKTFTLPGAPPAKTKTIAPAQLKIPLEIPADTIRDVLFITSNPPLVAVRWNSALGFQGSGMKDTVDIYSTRTMIRTDRVEYPIMGPNTQRVFDLAPDAVKMAVPFSKDRLYIHDLEAKTKLLDNFNPFEDAAVKRSGPPAAVRFLSGTSLLIADNLGGIDQWDLLTKAKVGSNPPLSDRSGPVFITESVGGKPYVYAGESLQPITILGQKSGAAIPIGGPGSQALGIGLDAAGTRTAVVYRATGMPAYGLAVLDLRKGAITAQLALPEPAGTPDDVGCFGNGSQALIITKNRTNAVLFDAESDTAVAYLSGGAGKPTPKIFSDGPNGRICWISPDPADPKKSLLLGVEANFDGYPALVTEAGAGKKPVAVALTAEGLAR